MLISFKILLGDRSIWPTSFDAQMPFVALVGEGRTPDRLLVTTEK